MTCRKGFTLIELIVVMAVFLFVIGAAITIFISIFQQQKRILSEQEFLNQISYSEEYMSKALRAAETVTDSTCVPAGYSYLLTHYNSGSGFYEGIRFFNQSNTADSGAPDPICQEFYWGNCDPANPDSLVLCEIKNNDQAE